MIIIKKYLKNIYFDKLCVTHKWAFFFSACWFLQVSFFCSKNLHLIMQMRHHLIKYVHICIRNKKKQVFSWCCEYLHSKGRLNPFIYLPAKTFYCIYWTFCWNIIPSSGKYNVISHLSVSLFSNESMDYQHSEICNILPNVRWQRRTQADYLLDRRSWTWTKRMEKNKQTHDR